MQANNGTMTQSTSTEQLDRDKKKALLAKMKAIDSTIDEDPSNNIYQPSFGPGNETKFKKTNSAPTPTQDRKANLMKELFGSAEPPLRDPAARGSTKSSAGTVKSVKFNMEEIESVKYSDVPFPGATLV